METLNPLGEDRLQLDRGVAEHVLGTAQGTHCVVVNVKAEAVEAKPDAHPIEMADESIASLEDPIKNVVDVFGWVVIADHRDGGMGTSANDQEATNPHVMGEQ